MSNFKTKIPSIEEMLEAGLHFGHPLRRKNPLMDEYVYAVEKKNSIIDLYQTEEKLQKALDFLYEIAKSGKQIVFVGTKRQAAEKIAEASKAAGALFVNERWLGGTLTNFNSVKRNCETLAELEEGLKSGKFDKYTKKEKLLIARKIEKLEILVGGIRNIKKYPGALVIIDPKREKTAVKEAEALNIPVVALIDTNSDPRPIDYPIPGNDDAMKAIAMFLDVVAGVIKEGYEAMPKEVRETKDKPENFNVEGLETSADGDIDEANISTKETPAKAKNVEKTKPAKKATGVKAAVKSRTAQRAKNKK